MTPENTSNEKKIVPIEPTSRKTGGVENLSFRRKTKIESENIIEGEIIEDKTKENKKPESRFSQNIKDLISGDNPEITDEWIKRQARLIIHPFGQTQEELDRILREGNSKFSNGDINEEDWEKFAWFIFEKLEKTKESKSPPKTTEPKNEELAQIMGKLVDAISGEGGLELPSNPDQQRELIRKYLDGIEVSNRDCFDPINGQIVRKLEVSLKDMDPSIADEVKVRLSLHDSSELMRQAGGNIKSEGGGLTIGGAATEALRRQHDITNRIAEVCYREGLPGIDIPQAWDLLEDANFQYPDLITEVNINFINDNLFLRSAKHHEVISILRDKKFDIAKLTFEEKENLENLGLNSDLLKNIYSISGTEDNDADPELGKVPTNYFTDSNIRRKEAARQLLVKKIGGDTRNAEKAIQLAEKMAWATQEVSVWNQSALVGNDQLAECLGFEDWRKRRREIGRPYGPEITLEAIKGFGTSWNRIQRPEGFKDNTEKAQYAKDVDIDKIKAGSWQGYCVADIGRFYALKELLLDTQPQPDKINTALLQQSVVYFNTADKPDLKKGEKTGEKALRVWWLAAIIDLAASNHHLGWNADSINKLHTFAVLDELSPQFERDENGEIVKHGGGTFITENQWEWIVKATNLYHRMGMVQGKQTFINVIGNIFSGGGGRKK